MKMASFNTAAPLIKEQKAPAPVKRQEVSALTGKYIPRTMGYMAAVEFLKRQEKRFVSTFYKQIPSGVR